MLRILRHATGQRQIPVLVAASLRSSPEDCWAAESKAAEKGADLEAIQALDPDLVEQESLLLGSILRQVVEGLPGPPCPGSLATSSPLGKDNGYWRSRMAGTTGLSRSANDREHLPLVRYCARSFEQKRGSREHGEPNGEPTVTAAGRR
jgi:hypothetical protein